MTTENTEIANNETEQNQAVAIASTAMASITNVPEYKITLANLVEKHKDAKFTDLDDKEGIKAVNAAYSETRQARLAVDKLGKGFKEMMKDATKQGEAQISELLDIVSPVEKEFKAQKDRIDELKEQAEQERLRLEEERKQIRVSQLFDLGLKFNGGYYALGDLSITPLQIAQFTEAQFEGFVAQAKVSYEAEQLRIAEEFAAEEKRRQEAEAEQERLRQEAVAKQKELDKQNAEMQAMIAERTDMRLFQLQKLSFVEVAIRNCWEYRDFIILKPFIESAPKAEWDAKIAAFVEYEKEVHKPKAPAPIVSTIQEREQEKRANDFHAPEQPKVNGTPVKAVEPIADPFEPTAFEEVNIPFKFSTENPFEDVKVGKATQRFYPEQFLDRANEGLTADMVSASGSLKNGVLFLVIKPKA